MTLAYGYGDVSGEPRAYTDHLLRVESCGRKANNEVMSEACDILGLYLHLARASARRRRLQVRDRMLVIAGANSARLELVDMAAYCRHLILENNRGHMVRRWATFKDALADNDFLHFLKQMQRRYPQEKAERMLNELGVIAENERAAYYTDEEYVAAIFGQTPESIQAVLNEDDGA